MGSRGQTETLGFVLVFALITASIGLVYATGFSGLNDVREFEAVNNAERAFEVFADNLEDITHRNAPSRSTEIKLSGAELRVAEPIVLEFNDPDAAFNVSYELRPVVYDADTGTEIVYAQGAVIRSQGDAGGVMVHESTLVLDENRTVVPIVQTRLQGNGQVAGSTTVLIRADLSQARLIYADTTPSTVWVNVTSPRAAAWQAHLDEAYPDASCSRTGDTVACSIETDRVYVTLVQVDLALE